MMNYSPRGLPGIIIDPADRITFFECDLRGYLTAVKIGYRLQQMEADGSLSYAPVEPLVWSYRHNDEGELAQIRYEDGTGVRFVYGAEGRLESTVRTR